MTKSLLIRHNMSVVVIVLSLIILACWIFTYIKILQFCTENAVQLRGLLKLVYLGKVSWGPALNKFFLITTMLFLTTWLGVSHFVYRTDHSFWIILYPILAIYFTTRYFLWFKEDLRELPWSPIVPWTTEFGKKYQQRHPVL